MALDKKRLKRRHRHNEEKIPQIKFKNTIMSTLLLGILIFIAAFLGLQNLMVKTTFDNTRKNAICSVFKNLKEINNQVQSIQEKIDEPFNNYIVKEDNGKIEYGNNNVMQEEVNQINNALFSNDIDYKISGIIIFKTKSNDKIELVGASSKDLWQAYKQANTRNDIKLVNIKRTYVIMEIPRYSIVYLIDIQNNATETNNAMLQIAIIMLVLALIFSYFLARSISRPLINMEKTISKISDGDLSGRLEYTNYNEINQLVNSYNSMADTLQKLYSTLEKQVQDRTQELKSAYAELQSTQAMMVHSEKMKSLGELVAGIMHEINNPINFIYGNMTHLSNYSNDLMQIIDEYSKYDDSLKPEEKTDVTNLKQEIDYEFLKTDLPDLIKSCKEGADRAKNIIQDLKSFSRMEEVAITDVDIPREIDTVLNILHNKIKNKADVHKEYMDNVPSVEAFGGQLNQVFMNILDNAVGAIKEHGDIWIRINKDKSQKNLIIEIEDNGVGMDSDTMDKVFNPFFTTKPVGQGTGLGMSITYKIIKNHQGDIKVESTPDVGTKFIVTLPLNINRDLLSAAVKDGEA